MIQYCLGTEELNRPDYGDKKQQGIPVRFTLKVVGKETGPVLIQCLPKLNCFEGIFGSLGEQTGLRAIQ